MGNTITTASEIALLCDMYRAMMPRTVALAEQGHPTSIKSLELRALGDEVEEQAIVACWNMLDRGWDWESIHTSAHYCLRAARSSRAHMILAKMAKVALQACGDAS